MSASEKLRELREEPYNSALSHTLGVSRDEPGIEAIVKVFRVLPKIAAVLAEVERGYPLMAAHYDPQDEPEAWWPQLHAALAELDEALRGSCAS